MFVLYTLLFLICLMPLQTLWAEKHSTSHEKKTVQHHQDKKKSAHKKTKQHPKKKPKKAKGKIHKVPKKKHHQNHPPKKPVPTSHPVVATPAPPSSPVITPPPPIPKPLTIKAPTPLPASPPPAPPRFQKNFILSLSDFHNVTYQSALFGFKKALNDSKMTIEPAIYSKGEFFLHQALKRFLSDPKNEISTTLINDHQISVAFDVYQKAQFKAYVMGCIVGTYTASMQDKSYEQSNQQANDEAQDDQQAITISKDAQNLYEQQYGIADGENGSMLVASDLQSVVYDPKQHQLTVTHLRPKGKPHPHIFTKSPVSLPSPSLKSIEPPKTPLVTLHAPQSVQPQKHKKVSHSPQHSLKKIIPLTKKKPYKINKIPHGIKKTSLKHILHPLKNHKNKKKT